MSSRLVVTLTVGELRVAFEIAGEEVVLLEAPDALLRSSTGTGGLQGLLPVTSGATFEISAEVHDGGPSA